MDKFLDVNYLNVCYITYASILEESMKMSDHILVEQKGAICIIKLNRPEKKNAITMDMYVAMVDALEKAESDSSVKVCVIATSGDEFCAGNDLQDFMANPDISPNNPVLRFVNILPTLKKPLLAAVEGQAVGIGVTMLFHCDMVYVGKSAALSLPFVNIALVPEAGSTLLLPKLVGHQKAAELLMLGEPIGADEAKNLQMVNDVVEDGSALSRALETAEKLAIKAPNALLTTKALMKSTTKDIDGRMQEEFKAFGACLQSPEVREAIMAFMEKRKPDFTQF